MGGGSCTSPAANIAHFQSVDCLVNTLQQCLMLDTTEALIKLYIMLMLLLLLTLLTVIQSSGLVNVLSQQSSCQ
jgi:hypothetical protein